jgi:hypothetical protein
MEELGGGTQLVVNVFNVVCPSLPVCSNYCTSDKRRSEIFGLVSAKLFEKVVGSKDPGADIDLEIEPTFERCKSKLEASNDVKPYTFNHNFLLVKVLASRELIHIELP